MLKVNAHNRLLPILLAFFCAHLVAQQAAPSNRGAGQLTQTINDFNQAYQTVDGSKVNFIAHNQLPQKIRINYPHKNEKYFILSRGFSFPKLEKRGLSTFEKSPQQRDYPEIIDIVAQLYGEPSTDDQGNTSYTLEVEVVDERTGMQKKGTMRLIVGAKNGDGKYPLIKKELLLAAPTQNAQEATSSTSAPYKSLVETIKAFNQAYPTTDKSEINFILHKERPQKIRINYSIQNKSYYIMGERLDLAQLDKRGLSFFEKNPEQSNYPEIIDILAQLYGKAWTNQESRTVYTLPAEVIGYREPKRGAIKLTVIPLANGRYRLIKNEFISYEPIKNEQEIVDAFNKKRSVGDEASLINIENYKFNSSMFTFDMKIRDPKNNLNITLKNTSLYPFDADYLINAKIPEFTYGRSVMKKSFDQTYPAFRESYFKENHKEPNDYHIYTALVDSLILLYSKKYQEKDNFNIETYILPGSIQDLSKDEEFNGNFELSFTKAKPTVNIHRQLRFYRDNNPFYRPSQASSSAHSAWSDEEDE